MQWSTYTTKELFNLNLFNFILIILVVDPISTRD